MTFPNPRSCHPRGHFSTCWVSDRTTRFRAAASLYPVINWYSWTLTSDIPIIGAKYWFAGNPWDFPEDYRKRSVISLVAEQYYAALKSLTMKTPTLLMTGEEDWRTPISEAEQYYAALKLLKIETRAGALPQRASRPLSPPKPPNRQSRLHLELVRVTPKKIRRQTSPQLESAGVLLSRIKNPRFPILSLLDSAVTKIVSVSLLKSAVTKHWT